MVKLITHTDLDGCGCAILAKLVFATDVDITYAKSIDNVNSYLECIKNPLIYDSIVITDLSCDEKFFATIPNLLLFDHHKTALKLNKFDNALVQVKLNDKFTCGTELFYQYLSDKYAINNIPYFIELIRSYDTWDWTKQFGKLPYYLNNLLYIRGINHFVESFTKKLMKNDINELNIFSTDDRLLLSYKEIEIEKFINDKRQDMYKKEIVINNQKLIIGICFADCYQSFLGNTLCKEENIDIAIMLNLNKNTCAVRSLNKEIDVSEIIKLITISSGGHQLAAGGVLDSNITDNVINYIVNKLEERK